MEETVKDLALYDPSNHFLRPNRNIVCMSASSLNSAINLFSPRWLYLNTEQLKPYRACCITSSRTDVNSDILMQCFHT